MTDPGNSMKIQVGRTGTFFYLILLMVVVFSGSGGCTAGNNKDSATDDRLCTLGPDGKVFRCSMAYRISAGAKCAETSPAVVKRNFILRMTGITLEMLYLDTEPGATPPFHFNDLSTVISRVEDRGCRSVGEKCLCDLAYSDPSLKEIFYDSAGCRKNSAYANHPLYFRGNGCR